MKDFADLVKTWKEQISTIETSRKDIQSLNVKNDELQALKEYIKKGLGVTSDDDTTDALIRERWKQLASGVNSVKKELGVDNLTAGLVFKSSNITSIIPDCQARTKCER